MAFPLKHFLGPHFFLALPLCSPILERVVPPLGLVESWCFYIALTFFFRFPQLLLKPGPKGVGFEKLMIKSQR